MKSSYTISARVIVEPDGDMFRAHFPALPGILICTRTEEEAFSAARESVVEYLQLLEKLEKPLPVGPDLIVESFSVEDEDETPVDLGFKSFGDPVIAGDRRNHAPGEEWENLRWPLTASQSRAINPL